MTALPCYQSLLLSELSSLLCSVYVNFSVIISNFIQIITTILVLFYMNVFASSVNIFIISYLQYEFEDKFDQNIIPDWQLLYNLKLLNLPPFTKCINATAHVK